MPRRCSHPKESRSLLYGYDVICGDCGEAIGRVALFPCAVIDAGEARALLKALPDAVGTHVEMNGREKLQRAARKTEAAHAG